MVNLKKCTIFTVIAALMFMVLGSAAPKASAATGFYVSGNKLYDSTGKAFVMRGVNHGHSWFKNDLNTAIPAIAKTGANTVRIVLSNGSLYTKDDLNAVKNIINVVNQNK